MTDIKVGETVRIKDNYPFSGGVGKRFVATKIIRRDFDYVVMGDQSGYGMWSKYLEKVEADPRWRYNDHIVVYPETRDQQGPGRGVTVLDETPLPKIYTRWENQDDSLTRLDDEITAAARAYWEAHEPNPVIKEAKVRGDYAYFAYQLRYNDTDQWLASYTKADIDAALPVIDRLALKAYE